MTLPSFNAEQSLYRSSRHYRSSALANVVGGVRPSDDPPPASYDQSCFNCAYGFLDVLSCICPDDNGYWRCTALYQASNCQGSDIANCDGFLTCGSCW